MEAYVADGTLKERHELTQVLVSCFVDDNDLHFTEAMDFAEYVYHHHTFTQMDKFQTMRAFNDILEKYRIQCQHERAKRLKVAADALLKSTATQNNHNILCLLINMARKVETSSVKEQRLPPRPPVRSLFGQNMFEPESSKELKDLLRLDLQMVEKASTQQWNQELKKNLENISGT